MTTKRAVSLSAHRAVLRFQLVTNTVEQALIFLPVLYALGATLDGAHFHLVPVFASMWALGRVMFTVGYHIDAKFRGPGLQMTLFTSLLAIAWLGYTLYMG